MNQPSIFQLPLWEKYKQNIFAVIHEALIILQNRSKLPLIEDHPTKHNLNRELYQCFREACCKKKLPHHLPTREGKNPPYEGDQEPTERESTIPDFYWHIIDDQAEDDFCERRFILECKRLGNLSSSSWNLNANYVNNGIRRFIVKPHEYGKGDDSGGMVGYIQSMSFDDIFEAVNLAINQSPEEISPLLSPTNGWKEKGISELEHPLKRSFPISPFRMYHFWIDIRSKY